jgi:hypothetical protein
MLSTHHALTNLLPGKSIFSFVLWLCLVFGLAYLLIRGGWSLGNAWLKTHVPTTVRPPSKAPQSGWGKE